MFLKKQEYIKSNTWREREREKEKERERISNGILALNALLLLLSTMKSSGLLVNGMKSQGQMQSKPDKEKKNIY